MAVNFNGLTYYKLDSKIHGYSGDITKNNSLRGEEIDGNFHFLRGHDIESVSIDKIGNLSFKRYNGEIITTESNLNQKYDFDYDSETGVLTIIKPDGEKIILNGFKPVLNINHDNTLEGDGTDLNPLKISETLIQDFNQKINANIDKINNIKITSNNKTIIVDENPKKETNIDVNVDYDTIIFDENGALSVNSNAFVKYEGINPIVIEDFNNEIKHVSLKIHKNDDILKIYDDGLLASLRLVRIPLGENKEELQLVGKDNIVISRIDITDLINVFSIEDIYLDMTDNNPQIVFIINNGIDKNIFKIPLKNLVNIYNAGDGLALNNNTFELKLDNESDEFLTLSNKGLKLYGIKECIENFKKEIFQIIQENEEVVSSALTNLEDKIHGIEDSIDVLKKSIEENEKTLSSSINEIEETVQDVEKSIERITVVINENEETLSSAITEIEKNELTISSSLNDLNHRIILLSKK